MKSKSRLYLLLVTLIISNFKSIAQTSTTTLAGAWGTASNWSNGQTPGTTRNAVINKIMTGVGAGLDPGAGFTYFVNSSISGVTNTLIDNGSGSSNAILDISASMSITGTLTIGTSANTNPPNNILYIRAGASVTVSGNIIFEKNSGVFIEPGGELIGLGDLTNAVQSDNITISGVIRIANNVSNSNGGVIGGTGSISAGGTFTMGNGGSPTVFGSSTVCGSNCTMTQTPSNCTNTSLSIAANQILCSTTTPNPLTATVSCPSTASGFSFQWQVFTNSGWNAASGVNNSFTTVTSSSLTSTYQPTTITATRAFRLLVTFTGCTSQLSNQVSLSIGAFVPSGTGTISGVSSICSNTNTVFSVSGISNVTTYNWTLPSGFTISSGAGTSSITASSSISGTMIISVSGSNGCGNGSAFSRTTTVSGTPATVPGIISGSTSVCVSTTGVVYSVTSVSGYSYRWIMPTGFVTTSGANTNSVTISLSGTAVSSTISVTGTNTCGTSAARTSAITANASGFWLGTSNTNWNNAANWCGGIPSASSSPIISSPSTNYPVLTTSGVSIANLSILGTSSLSLSSGLSLSISGNVVNNGTFTIPSSSTIALTGTTQSLSGSSTYSFNNLSLSNGSKTLSSLASLSGVLTMGSTTTLTSNGNLTLISNASGSASVSSMSGTAAITGNVRVQNYMGSKINRRYLSFPVSGATLLQLKSSIWLNGPASDANFDTPNYIPSVLVYDETMTGQINIGKKVVTSTSQTFASGVGYEVLVRPRTVAATETRANQPTTPVTLEVVGTLNQGNQTFPISFTNTGNGTADGYNFVGNPYPSSIDWTVPGWTKTNIAPTIYFLDPGSSLTATTSLAGQSYAYIPGTGCVPAVAGCNSLIAQGQGFYVLATASGAVLSATESVKSTGVARRNFRTEEDNSTDLIRVTATAPNGMIDETVLRVGDSFTDGYDNAAVDVKKFPNANINLSTKSQEGYNLVLNSMPISDTNKVIPLVFSSNISGVYSLKVSTNSLATSAPQLYIRNNTDSSLVEVTSEETVSFVHVTSVTSAPKYSLVMKKSARVETPQTPEEQQNPQSIKENGSKNSVMVYPNPFSEGMTIVFGKAIEEEITVVLQNMLGNEVFKKTYSSLDTKSGKLEIEKLEVPNSTYLMVIKTSNGVYQTVKVSKY